jgi:hypothetical protein
MYKRDHDKASMSRNRRLFGLPILILINTRIWLDISHGLLKLGLGSTRFLPGVLYRELAVPVS